MKQGTVKKLSIKEVKPYWRNPRENELAVGPVVDSIARFGYNQLIAVDKENVIIAGHTRYKALLQLGYDEIEVMELDLTEPEAKAYRIIDNKSNEMASWSADLVPELREIEDTSFMQRFFTEDLTALISASVGVNAELVSQAQVEAAQASQDSQFKENSERYEQEAKPIICPHCNQEFFIR